MKLACPKLIVSKIIRWNQLLPTNCDHGYALWKLSPLILFLLLSFLLLVVYFLLELDTTAEKKEKKKK